MPVAELAVSRTASGQFVPGRSGNPAGRPRGARNHATVLAETMFEDNAEALARTAVDRALAGDGATARFLLGRILPRTAGRTVTLDLAPGKERDLVHVHELVVRAMADGEVTPQEALQIGRLLAIGAKLQKLARTVSRQEREAAAEHRPVSHLYPAAEEPVSGASTPLAAGAGGESPHPDLPPQAGEGADLFPSCISSAPSGNPAEGAPVSDLYSDARSPLPLAGEGGDPTRSFGEGEGSRGAAGAAAPALGPALTRKWARESAPVSGLYFSTGRAAA